MPIIIKYRVLFTGSKSFLYACSGTYLQSFESVLSLSMFRFNCFQIDHCLFKLIFVQIIFVYSNGPFFYSNYPLLVGVCFFSIDSLFHLFYSIFHTHYFPSFLSISLLSLGAKLNKILGDF